MVKCSKTSELLSRKDELDNETIETVSMETYFFVRDNIRDTLFVD